MGENGQDYFPFSGVDGKVGGAAAGGIFVESNATLNLTGDNSFSANSATGGVGGTGASSSPFHVEFVFVGPRAGGAGGAGGFAISPEAGTGEENGGSSGLPGTPGAPPIATPITLESGQPVYVPGSGAGGSGGTAYADFGGSGTIEFDAPVCFAKGTRIRTVRGDVPVEGLVIGDLVVTTGGATRPIQWLGSRTLDCRHHPRPADVMPVRIAAGAFGAGRPARDLWLSPGHSVCLDILGEVLIPAIALVDGTAIAQVAVDEMTYWHVELDCHEVILAEGLPAESYLEMGNRSFFAEGDLVALHASPDAKVKTHADFCRPFVAEGSEVEAVKARLCGRAIYLAGASRECEITA